MNNQPDVATEFATLTLPSVQEGIARLEALRTAGWVPTYDDNGFTKTLPFALIAPYSDLLQRVPGEYWNITEVSEVLCELLAASGVTGYEIACWIYLSPDDEDRHELWLEITPPDPHPA